MVTELAYHNKQTIDADVSFLSEAEWRAELTVLLHDLVDEDGNIKRSTDLKSDAGVAWQKVCFTAGILIAKLQHVFRCMQFIRQYHRSSL